MLFHESPPWEGKSPEEVLREIADDVLDYVSWHAENGYYLPKDFEKDLDGWTDILCKIETAFGILLLGDDFLLSKAQIKKKDKGLELFYKHMSHLWR